MSPEKASDEYGTTHAERRPKQPVKRRAPRANPGSARFQDADVAKAVGREETADGLFGEVPEKPAVNRGGIVPPGGVPGPSDPRKRSKFIKPVRLGKRWAEIITEIDNGDLTWGEFVSTLTPTELARGQLANKNGMFSGRPPSLVPRAFHDACIRELMHRGQTLYRQDYLQAIKAMTAIANDTSAKDADRIKAAQFVIERLEGKAVQKVEISGENPFEAMLEGVLASVEEDKAIANAQNYLDRIGPKETP